ncbi:17686_t:CDS:2, partial [Funneliformis geosporum]
HSDNILILGPNGYYIEIKISSSDDRDFKCIGKCDAYSLFQDDLEKEIETKSNPENFEDFIKNSDVIWENTPKPIKKEYKLLSEELERKISNQIENEVDGGTSSSKPERTFRGNNVSYVA